MLGWLIFLLALLMALICIGKRLERMGQALRAVDEDPWGNEPWQR